MGSKRGRKKSEPAALMLTSMMDMFTIILTFLLKSYSSEGSLLTNADNLVLPNSSSKKKPQDVSLQIAISSDMVLVDNRPVVPTEDVKRISQENSDQSVPKLIETLEKSYKQEEEMVRLGALNKVEGKVVIQVDKNIDFDVLYKIMASCGKVGYNTMNFAVMEREQ